MSTQFLATKLFIPPLRSEIVSRPALLERINKGLDRKLTLISAPAGFGKTTLLCEWAESKQHILGWVSLDDDDNDPIRFWSYFIKSIATIYENFGDALLAELQSTQPPSTNAFLTSLINEIVAGDFHPFAVVLDDYHIINTPDIHEGIAFFIENCPTSLHLVISTRSDPQLPLGKYRVRRQLNELRSDDLRFTLQEASDFFNKNSGLDIRREEIEALGNRTEGWIAGLQMAAISLKGLLQTQQTPDLSFHIEAFTGSHRYVMDYLIDEVINQQNEETRAFLFETSILERMTASLCEFVTGNQNSKQILDQLERDNLFLIPLDHERHWYRYHLLFADLLRNQLPLRESKKISSLHILASKWYEKNGWYADALKHALLANDMDQVVKLVEDNATTLIYHGELTTISIWLEQLPEHIRRAHPWLSISHAWALLFKGQLESAKSLLLSLEAKFLNPELESNHEPPELNVQRLYGHVYSIRGHASYLEGDFQQAIALIKKALGHLPNSDLMARSLSTGIMIAAHRWLGEVNMAAQITNKALDFYQSTDDKSIQVTLYFNFAKTMVLAGHLREAYDACQAALKLSEATKREGSRLLFNIGYVYGCMSILMLEWNHLEPALQYAQECIDVCRQWGQVDALADGYLQLSRILQVTGKHEKATRILRRAEQLVQRYSHRIGKYMSANLAKLYLRQGNIEVISEWERHCGLAYNDQVNISEISVYIILARVLMAQQKCDNALDLLRQLEKLTAEASLLTFQVETLILLAIAWRTKKDEAQALQCIKLAVIKAKPEGFIRIFIDEGPPIAGLLGRLHADGIEITYVGKLLSAFDNESYADDLAGLLTDREWEVLKLLTTPATHAEIADQLYISRNTVRSHVKHIYNKLNANNRLDAVEKAREFGLIP